MGFEGLIWFHVMGCWLGLSEGCDVIPPFMMYAVPGLTALFSGGGVYGWHRFIKNRPASKF